MPASLTDLAAYQGEPRTSLGWRLAKTAWRLLRQDRGLRTLVLLVTGLFVLQFAVPLLVPDLSPGIGPEHQHHVLIHAVGGAIVVFSAIFMAMVLAIAADATIDGFPVDAIGSLREAAGMLGPIVRWSLFSVAVWYAVQIAANSLETIWPAVLFVLAWNIASFFVIPVMAIERVGPGEAVAESIRLVRKGWRQAVAGLLGIALFYAIALLLPALMLSHSSAVQREGNGVIYPLVIGGVVLVCLVAAAAVATVVAFAVLLERQIAGDLPGAEYSGRRLRRGTKALRVCGTFVLVVFLLIGFSTATRHDRRINSAARAPGGNFIVLADDRFGYDLPTGSPVTLEGRTIGVVLGSHAEGSNLRVGVHVEPGYGPTETPGSFLVISAGIEGPQLVLLPARLGSGTESQPF